jgi:hypothetical protein
MLHTQTYTDVSEMDTRGALSTIVQEHEESHLAAEAYLRSMRHGWSGRGLDQKALAECSAFD